MAKKEPRSVYQDIQAIKEGLAIVLECMKEYELDATTSQLHNKLYRKPRDKNYREAKKKVVDEIDRKYAVIKHLKS
jgi:hypothetical protein